MNNWKPQSKYLIQTLFLEQTSHTHTCARARARTHTYTLNCIILPQNLASEVFKSAFQIPCLPQPRWHFIILRIQAMSYALGIIDLWGMTFKLSLSWSSNFIYEIFTQEKWVCISSKRHGSFSHNRQKLKVN